MAGGNTLPTEDQKRMIHSYPSTPFKKPIMVNDQQVITLRTVLEFGTTLRDAASMTGMDEHTARKYARTTKLPSECRPAHTWKTRPDPFTDTWPTLLHKLRATPGIPATHLLESIVAHHPDRFSDAQLRTLQRRMARWREEQGSAYHDASLPCRCSPSAQWMASVLQKVKSVSELREELGDSPDLPHLFDYTTTGTLAQRNKALTILAWQKGIGSATIAGFLGLSPETTKRYIALFSFGGLATLFSSTKNVTKKADDAKYVEAVISTLHSPPRANGINRTTWKQGDLHRVLAAKGFSIGRQSIRAILRKEGYNWRKARRVLTSHDPQYREKVARISAILANISPRERFFSIDEYGPFNITIRGGRKLVAPGEDYTVPQWQKSKGSLIVTGALELCTNQVTHFYSEHKNTEEMIRLLEVLLGEYAGMDTLYLSWDAASWHLSNGFEARVAEVNAMKQSHPDTPRIELAPLPSCAQFLNVIESVFSGMARAIIHNSDYQSVEVAMQAIDRYFKERNEAFRENPRRAGKKIWGHERVAPVFTESNNCKDPRWQR